MTAPRYKDPNSKETVTIRASAPTAPGTPTKEGMPCMIPAHAQLASRDATTYFQTAASTGPIPKCIGLPAYQRAGIVKIQKDAVQAAAIPTAPHRSARTNNRHVAVTSISPQRNQRSAFPMERWIQLWT